MGDVNLKMWLNVGIETDIPWVGAKRDVPFDGRVLVLHPTVLRQPDGLNDSASVSVAFNEGPPQDPLGRSDPRGEPRCASYDEARLLIERFLSAVAWNKQGAISTHGEYSHGYPQAVPERLPARGVMLGETFDRLSHAGDDDALIALALYREGLSANRVSYQFLAFARILSIKRDSQGAFSEWVNEHLDAIGEQDVDAKHRLDSLRAIAKDLDVGRRLYRQRCAVAHASRNPRTDPDSVRSVDRLHEDLPLMQAIARHFIETEMDIRRVATRPGGGST